MVFHIQVGTSRLLNTVILQKGKQSRSFKTEKTEVRVATWIGVEVTGKRHVTPSCDCWRIKRKM